MDKRLETHAYLDFDGQANVTLRLRHGWVKAGVSLTPEFEGGTSVNYLGMVKRWAKRFGPLGGVYVMHFDGRERVAKRRRAKMTKKVVKRHLATLTLLMLLGACTSTVDAEDTDLDLGQVEVTDGTEARIAPSEYEVRAPDSITVFLNSDDHATINRLCLDGVAFRTVSTTHQAHTTAVERVEEWDDECPLE